MSRRHNDQGNTSCNTPPRDEAVVEWFRRSLISLGLPNPDSFACLAQPGEVDVAVGGTVLRDFVVWMEHHVIRQWTVDDRKKLRNDFCSSVEQYLSDLDCPAMYRMCRDGNGKPTSWQDDPYARRKVVFWLVSCAISEVYSDQAGPVEDATEIASGNVNNNAVLLSCIDKDSFPLGFSTNSSAVDDIVNALRMKYLMDLRNLQNKVNLTTSNMQQITVNEGGHTPRK